MGTDFDDFSEKAHRNYTNLDKKTLQNRQFLEKIMQEVGFVGFESEWWHFDFEGWEECPFLDVGNGPLEEGERGE